MNEPVALRDLANINPSLARGLQQLLDYDGDDVEDTFCRSFVGEIEEWGEVREVELLPGGASKMVTNDNREGMSQLLTNLSRARGRADPLPRRQNSYNSTLRSS